MYVFRSRAWKCQIYVEIYSSSCKMWEEDIPDGTETFVHLHRTSQRHVIIWKNKGALEQAVEAHRVRRRQGSHIFYAIGSQMAVRLSVLRAGRPLPPGRFLALISFSGWVNGRAVAQAVSRWLPTAAVRVRFRAACGVCGGQSGTGAGFLRVLRFPLPIIPPVSPSS
jgi:hypothetical protein